MPPFSPHVTPQLLAHMNMTQIPRANSATALAARAAPDAWPCGMQSASTGRPQPLSRKRIDPCSRATPESTRQGDKSRHEQSSETDENDPSRELPGPSAPRPAVLR